MKKKAILFMMVLMFISTNAFSQSWIQGKISGDVQTGIGIELYKTGCGGDVLVDTFTTNSEGYYGFGCLANGTYKVIPDNATYDFDSELVSIQIPQTQIQSYDFIATSKCGNGILNQGEECDDGNRVDEDACNNMCIIEQVWCTVTDTYGLILRDDANCGGLEVTVGHEIYKGQLWSEWSEDYSACETFPPMNEQDCLGWGWIWH